MRWRNVPTAVYQTHFTQQGRASKTDQDYIAFALFNVNFDRTM